MFRRLITNTIVVVVIACCLLVSGCSKLNRKNYGSLKVGMKYAEVVSLLGEPDVCDSVLGAKNCTWGSESKNINVKFVAANVALFSCKGL